ncbi:HAD-IB family hydrolase [Shewanella sp. SR1]|uniref:HAD-IB family hydrolase n=1 Tax=Shewanella sp. SR1 TaxID=2855505 RepID=UPI001CF4A377|nr:HAD-IB family hydrolase [Shewanella sp. SR1]MCB2383499.1 HAD-IB family hydrolase [Shewanella sp. SR1]
MNLALFDFDGTITDADMYTKFIRFTASKRRTVVAGCLLLPLYSLYRIGWFPARKLRPIVSYLAFRGRDYQQLNTMAATYAQEVIPKHVMPHALNKIRWHQENGDTVVVVSASLDVYLKHWCTPLGLTLISSELEVKNGILSGYYATCDVSCETKAIKVRHTFDLNSYERIYAYGDTAEDQAMLQLAHEKYMNWNEVTY